MLSKTVSQLGLKICYPKRQLSAEAGCQRPASSAWGRCNPGEQWNRQSTGSIWLPKEAMSQGWDHRWKQPLYLQNTLSLTWPASPPPPPTPGSLLERWRPTRTTHSKCNVIFTLQTQRHFYASGCALRTGCRRLHSLLLYFKSQNQDRRSRGHCSLWSRVDTRLANADSFRQLH